jgi:transposase
MRPEVRMSRYLDGICRYEQGRLSCVEAAELLGISERHFRRLRDRYEAEGAEGLIDRRRGRLSGRRAAVDRIEFVVEQYRTRYFDFTVKHFHEALCAEHPGFNLSYTWTKTVLQQRGLVPVSSKRSAHRKKRVRRPLPGMMLFQDGSRYVWLGGQPPLDLIVTMDDATSEIFSIVLVEEEGTVSAFWGLHETIAAKGLFSSFYTDRGSHYFLTPQAGGKVDRNRLTQVGRALAELKIEHIASYSPEGRGRMERVLAPCKSGCRRFCGSTTSPPSKRRTGSSKRSMRPSTTRALPWLQPKKDRLSYPSSVISKRCCAFANSASSPTTTACAMMGASCRFPSSATDAIS